MEIVTKQLSNNVKSLNGYIVYAMGNHNRPHAAEICTKENLAKTVKRLFIRFKS